MNPPAMPACQTIGNICVAIAALVFLLPLQHLLWDYARKNLNNDQWVTPALFILIPLWLLLMAALLCVTASGGFDWLRLGRPALYALTVAATLSLAVVSFVLIAMYIRPGFTPRIIYCPPLYLVHLGTLLLIILSLNPKLALGFSPQVVRLPWTIFAALSLIACVGFFGYRLVHTGVGSMANIAHRIRPRPSRTVRRGLHQTHAGSDHPATKEAGHAGFLRPQPQRALRRVHRCAAALLRP